MGAKGDLGVKPVLGELGELGAVGVCGVYIEGVQALATLVASTSAAAKLFMFDQILNYYRLRTV